MKKIFWILIAVIALAVAYKGIMLLPGNSETINGEQPTEFNFDASQYPLAIDKAKYPELSAFEKEISAEYALMLQAFAEGFKDYGYECFAGPKVSELSFNHLKPRQNLYMIESICGVPGEPSPYSGAPAILLYASEGKAVMFFIRNIESRFTDAFNKMESPDEAKEYSEQYVDDLSADLDSALNNSLFGDLSSADFIKGCPLLSEIPKLASTVSKTADGFVYEGLRIEPEGKARLYYFKYTITPDGQAAKEKDEMLAMCARMGIIY